jgi:hypothetical protein
MSNRALRRKGCRRLRRFVTALQHPAVGGPALGGESPRQRDPGRRTPLRRPESEVPLASSRPPHAEHRSLMVDYQFLGMVAVALAVVTRGSLFPVLAMTALVALAMLASEATLRRYRRRHTRPVTPDAAPSDADITRWMSVMDRVLRTRD